MRRITSVFRVAAVLISVTMLSAGCAMTPARRTLDKGKVGIDFSLGTVLVDTPYTKVVPYMAAGIQYGISDRLNIGISVNPVLLAVSDTFLLEPNIVWNLFRQHGEAPTLSLYSSFPLLLSFAPSFTQLSIQMYPLLGVLHRRDIGQFGMYTLFEGLLDRRWTDDSPYLKFNVRIGFELSITDAVFLGLEGGINALGEDSSVYGWTYGQPVLKAGLMFVPRRSGI